MTLKQEHAALIFARYGWLWVAAAIGCGPTQVERPPPDAADRYADAICLAHERCGCSNDGFSSHSECVAFGRETFRWVEDWPKVNFDSACFEDFIKHLAEDASCGGQLDQFAAPCIVFSGGLGIGEPCVSEITRRAGGLSESSCASGAECVAGKCARPPRPAVEEGEDCNLSRGVVCGTSYGLYCSRDAKCSERHALGDACDTPIACDRGWAVM